MAPRALSAGPGQADWIGSVQPDRLAELHVLRELDASPEVSPGVPDQP